MDFNSMRDPWGNPYRATFSIDKQSDIVVLRSAGADKRFGTDDDFSVERFSWPYFRPTGQLIDRVAGQYHTRTRGFIRDLDTLRRELAKEEFVLDQLRDRWNKPYRVSFNVKETLFLINVESSGPDGRFSTAKRESWMIFTFGLRPSTTSPSRVQLSSIRSRNDSKTPAGFRKMKRS